MMRRGVSPHHTNPRSATLDFWRKTSTIAEYKQIQVKMGAEYQKSRYEIASRLLSDQAFKKVIFRCHWGKIGQGWGHMKFPDR